MKQTAAVVIVTLAAAVIVRALAVQPEQRLQLQFEDYAQLPITGELDGQNTRGQLARVNVLHDEPGGRRFFVNDLNGPLYILDKRTKQFTVYLDFKRSRRTPRPLPKFTFERNFATGLTNFVFDPDYPRNGVFYTLHMEDPNGAGSPTPKPADLQPDGAARRSRLEGDVSGRRRLRLGRPARQPPNQSSAAGHPGRLDPAHRARPAPVLREIPNSAHRAAIFSPSSRRATNRSRSSMT